MSIAIKVNINDALYLRDPQETKLGKKIIQFGIELIDKLGLEAFTFKKLADRIGSTESSIYRYFENKHFFLVYLLSWYWEWMNFRIDFNSMNVNDPKEKLRIVILTIVDTIRKSAAAEYIDRDALHRIVVAEGTKAYHIKEIDEENSKGFFLTYKSLNSKIAGIIKEVQPDFPYPNALAINRHEMANDHMYFSEHLPSLTDCQVKDGKLDSLVRMLEFFTFRMLGLPAEAEKCKDH